MQNKLLCRCLLQISTDYHQFYISDPAADSVLTNWSDQDITNRLIATPGCIIICPVRNCDLPVEIGIWETEPQIHFNAWQHVVEAPLTTGGFIEVDECTGRKMARFKVEPGEYTVRVLFRGLDTISEDESEGKDFYEIQIWKASCNGLRVLRLWD